MGNFNGYKGEEQPKQFQDVAFSILFFLHLTVMIGLGAMYGPAMVSQNAGNYSSGGELTFIVSLCGLVAMGVSSVSLALMMKFPRELVRCALIFTVVTSLAFAIFLVMLGQLLFACLGFLNFAISICYACMVWNRVAFAAANLVTALTAIQANIGVAIVAYIFTFVGFAWSLFWVVAAGGTMNSLGQGALFLFLVSYYWVHQVLFNTVHVTTTGVVGTWWFSPLEASSCCSSAVGSSFTRATTHSFGSICFGSLLVAVVQALRTMLDIARSQEGQEGCNILVCLLQCVLGCIEGIIEELNKWAYVYVGLYGYSYLEAGRNVMVLFQQKGWTTIITDSMVENVLSMTSVGIGLVTGLVGLIIASSDQAVFYAMGFENPQLTGFIIGLLVGYVLSSILMSVISSAVNTVIVCFAEAPREFQQNHPELSNEMRSAWREAWPEECGF
jgi:hypothetical protein